MYRQFHQQLHLEFVYKHCSYYRTPLCQMKILVIVISTLLIPKILPLYYDWVFHNILKVVGDPDILAVNTFIKSNPAKYI